ncbi:ZCW7 isoform 1 [Hibiscus syriacus]|uniref:ZCW7 isoform 1 n=1 Tax=Hibiscus syriacus TaxID=106335 RepID=A0A6A2YUZ8_HIBSY|nr:uncharacterized protein LOC120155993 [Hibiscus syriacus]KAE8683321.1 ZCW7 isoform 1 [Hibiscus syriacus]
MFQPCICGALDPEDEGDHRKLRRNSFGKSKGRKKDDKNPYSDRGLDKFSALLAELEEKKQKIYSQTGSQDVSLVRFTYGNSTDFVPIVIKLKDDKEETKKKGADGNTNTPTKDHQVLDSDAIDKHPIMEGKRAIKKTSSRSQSFSDQKKKKSSSSWNFELHQWRRPSYYVPAIVVLILLLLVFFGRSVSILFTCIAWYSVPVIQGKSYSKKKGYVRKLSYKKVGAG